MQSGIVYVLDDDEAVADSVVELAESVGHRARAFHNPTEFVQHASELAPGCLVIDMRMPGLSGLEVQRQLKEQGTNLKLVFLTGHGDVQSAVQAMREGAVDFLTKPVRDQELLDSVHNALASLAPENRGDCKATETVVISERLDQLTSREREVMQAVVRGEANKSIASQLGISSRTVEVHRSRVMQKMGTRRLADLVRACLAANAV